MCTVFVTLFAGKESDIIEPNVAAAKELIAVVDGILQLDNKNPTHLAIKEDQKKNEKLYLLPYFIWKAPLEVTIDLTKNYDEIREQFIIWFNAQSEAMRAKKVKQGLIFNDDKTCLFREEFVGVSWAKLKDILKQLNLPDTID